MPAYTECRITGTKATSAPLRRYQLGQKLGDMSIGKR